MASDPDCLSVASEAVLANRPFSTVTLDTMVTTTSHEGHKSFDQIEDLCPKKGEENVSLNVKHDVTDDACADMNSDFLPS